MRAVPADLMHRLRTHHQDHVLFGWDRLSIAERQNLVNQLAGIDLELIDTLYANRNVPQELPSNDRITPVVMECPSTFSDKTKEVGEVALARGEVAALLVAGGQGSRLGFEKPKGMFPIGPVSGKSLFQIHAEKIFALSRRYGKSIPLLVMTSPATHNDTEGYFEENRYFGLGKDNVYFFQQGTMPAVDISSGQILLEKPGVLFTSPNGHGGTLTAMSDSGLLDDIRARGIRHIYYFQVDNPLVKIAEPLFIGRHVEARSEMSSKAIMKAYPKERMGIFAMIDQRCSIIEYSDLPEELAHACDPNDRLLHCAGSPAIHLFDVDFLIRITQGETRLPFHVARKKVPCLDQDGNPFQPIKENALKFEMFVFDALPLAERTLIVESPRSEEFAPVKNATDVDSPDTARQAISNLAGRWLEHAGVNIARDQSGNVAFPLEISPRFALDPQELVHRVWAGRTLEDATYFE